MLGWMRRDGGRVVHTVAPEEPGMHEVTQPVGPTSQSLIRDALREINRHLTSPDSKVDALLDVRRKLRPTYGLEDDA